MKVVLAFWLRVTGISMPAADMEETRSLHYTENGCFFTFCC